MTTTATLNYYETNAVGFVKSTWEVDMTSFYDLYLPLIPIGGHILDLGCGSGRDTHAFLNRGFKVTALDASPSIAALAEEYTGHPVRVQSIESLNDRQEFDGIWACASLLHIPKATLKETFQRLGDALRVGGVLYASFKYGDVERLVEGRHFTYLNETSLAFILQEQSNWEYIKTWQSQDRRPERQSEIWLNVLMRNR